MSYISETAANCAGILERGARRMAEAAKREAILKAEMQAALRATLADAPAPAPAPARAIKGERVFYARWTSAERGNVAQLYKAGTPLHDIAAVIGRTERAVCAMATRLRAEGVI